MQLSGEGADLAFLEKAFNSGDIRVSKEGDSYFLSSNRFDGLADANAVKDAATVIAAMLGGACRLALNGSQPVTIGNAIYRDESGKSHYNLFAGLGEFYVRGVPAGLTKLLGGEGGGTSEELAKKWVTVAMTAGAVANVLRIYDLAPLDWVNLYRVGEIIWNDAGGQKALVSRGWIADADLSLFTWTANSFDVLGLEARHGVQRGVAPPNPMTLTDSRRLVRVLTWKWLQAKLGE